MRWLLIFCLGFYFGAISIEAEPRHCETEAAR